MNALIWLLRGFLFIVLLGLAIKNSGEIELRFFFDASWQTPLALALLVALVLGVILGLLALLPRLVRQRRTIGVLSRQLATMNKPLSPHSPQRAATDIDSPTTGI